MVYLAVLIIITFVYPCVCVCVRMHACEREVTGSQPLAGIYMGGLPRKSIVNDSYIITLTLIKIYSSDHYCSRAIYNLCLISMSPHPPLRNSPVPWLAYSYYTIVLTSSKNKVQKRFLLVEYWGLSHA